MSTDVRLGSVRPPLTGERAALIAVVGWGFTPIWIRLLGDLPALAIAGGRLTLALPFLLLFLFLTRDLPSREDLAAGYSWWFGACLSDNYLCTVVAVQLLSVAEAASLLNTSPLFALWIGRLLGRGTERFQILGAWVAVAGLLLAIAPGLTTGATPLAIETRLAGDGLALAGATMMATYSTLHHRMAGEGRGPAPSAVAVCSLLLGVVLLAGWIAASGDPRSLLADRETGATLIALAIVSTALPTVMFSLASVRLHPVTVHTYRLLTPLMASFAALVLLGEIPSVWMLPGGALVLGGLWVIAQRRRA